MKLVEGAFLVSYLLQYWGAREGSSRIFLGAAALAAVNLLVVPATAIRGGPGSSPTRDDLRAGDTLTGLSFLVRARPRLCAWVLVTITALLTGFLAWFSFAATPYPQPWAFVVRRRPVHPPLRLHRPGALAGIEIA